MRIHVKINNIAPFPSTILTLKVNKLPNTKRGQITVRIQNALESFKKYLTTNNLKLTQQRLLIFKILMGDEKEVSSEQLHTKVKRVDETVSRSTVYRTVKHLHNAGLARCVHQLDGVTCYEPMTNLTCKMVCEQCGKTIPIKNPYFECIQQETARQQGFTLFRYQNVIYGLCCECNGKSLKPPPDTAVPTERISK